MDYHNIDAETFGASLTGVGLNILVRDVLAQTAFLTHVFELKAYQATRDFAIIAHAGQVFQLHSDGTYHSHPLQNLLPENPPRGAGIEIRLYHIDPDAACSRAEEYGATILAAPKDKPHGLLGQ